MKKFLKNLLNVFGVIVVIVIISIILMSLYKKNIKDLMVSSVDGYVYLNFNNYSKNKHLQDLAVELTEIYGKSVSDTIAEGNNYTKYINSFFLLHSKEDMFAPKEIEKYNAVAGIDVGLIYFPAVTQLGRVFDKENKIYVLKKDMKKSFDIPEKYNIYMYPYRGIFLFSISREVLGNFVNKLVLPKNEKLKEIYNSQKDRAISMAFDLTDVSNKFIPKNEMIKSVGYMKGVIDFNYSLQKIYTDFSISGEGKGFEMLDASGIKDRELLRYITPNTYYICNNNITNLLKYLSGEIYKINETDYIGAVSSFIGFDIYELTKSLGGEVIFGTESETPFGMINIKNEGNVRNYITSLGGIVVGTDRYAINSPDGSPMANAIIREGKLFINKDWDKAENDVLMTKETFFYSKMNIGQTFGIESLNTFFVEIDARYNPSYNIDVNIQASKYDIISLLKLF